MPPNRNFTPYDLERANAAISYINKHYQDACSAEQLAMEVNMNIKQLQVLVQLITGLTIHNYHMKVRADQAKEELSDFRKSIKCIGYKHGYSSPSHFSREFKKQNGLTPTEYRQQLISTGNLLLKINGNKQTFFP